MVVVPGNWNDNCKIPCERCVKNWNKGNKQFFFASNETIAFQIRRKWFQATRTKVLKGDARCQIGSPKTASFKIKSTITLETLSLSRINVLLRVSEDQIAEYAPIPIHLGRFDPAAYWITAKAASRTRRSLNKGCLFLVRSRPWITPLIYLEVYFRI